MATCDTCKKSGIPPGRMQRHKELHCKGRVKVKKMPKRRGTSIDPNVIVSGNNVQKKVFKDIVESESNGNR